MSTKCTITFDQDIYNSGETLSGQVQLETVKSKSIRGISINIVGSAKVCWLTPTDNDIQRAYHKSNEILLTSNTYVKGSFDGNTFDLEPGIYNYTFSHPLPKDLPSSVDIKDGGNIRYEVIVTIHRRLKFNNDFKKHFIVNHILDLNSNPQIMLPKRNYVERDLSDILPLFGQSCCGSSRSKQNHGSKIKAELKISCGGYVPGQNVFYELNINNNSNIDLSNGAIKLIKCYTFTSTSPAERDKDFTQDIGILNIFNQIPRGTNKDIKDNFQLPNLTPTQRTKYIKISYKLEVAVQLSFKSSKQFTIHIPIVVGSMPAIDNKDIIEHKENLNNINRNVKAYSTTSANNLINQKVKLVSNNSVKNAIGYSINPNDVTIIKLNSEALYDESCITYGWK